MDTSPGKGYPITRRDFFKVIASAGAGLAARQMLEWWQKSTGPFAERPQQAKLADIQGLEMWQRPVYWGLAANHSEWTPPLHKLDAAESAVGKKAGIFHWYQDWSGVPEASNFPGETMQKVRERGTVPMITWMPEDARQERGGQSEYSLNSILSGKYDGYITKWALEAKKWGHPFYLRFAHEMNGNSYWPFPWVTAVNQNTGEPAPYGNTPENYVKVWRKIHDIFTQNGVNNVTWVWCPDTAGDKDFRALYPGDNYVDWVGIDGYNRGGQYWKSFSDIFTHTYNGLLDVAPQKPFMLAEWATQSQGGDASSWLTDALVNQLPNNYPQVQAVVYFDRDRTAEEGVNWNLESDINTKRGFASGISSNYYIDNRLGNINTPKIPIGRKFLQLSP